jgi:hypothetical protein
MAFIRTIVNTKQNKDAPDYSTWLNNLDSSTISEFPEYAGMTPLDAVASLSNNIEFNQRSRGLVSVDKFASDESSTLVETWENYDSYIQAGLSGDANNRIGNISCSTSSNIVTGHEGIFDQRRKFLMVGSVVCRFNYDTNTATEIGTVSSIDSNTSITLTSNAKFDIDNRIAYCEQPSSQLLLSHLNKLYQTEHPFTTTITEANI